MISQKGKTHGFMNQSIPIKPFRIGGFSVQVRLRRPTERAPEKRRPGTKLPPVCRVVATLASPVSCASAPLTVTPVGPGSLT